MFNVLNPFPENKHFGLGIGIMIVGFVFMAIGMWIYMKAGQCCSPRDSLLVGVGKRLLKLPIGIVEVLLWAVILLFGWLLGGKVGVGTLISTFGAGMIMQLVYTIIHFESREVQHKGLVEVTKYFLETVDTISTT